MRQFRILAILTAFLSIAGCTSGYDAPIRGSISLAPTLLNRARMPNTVLFIVAQNQGGVPVAVQRIVNPLFPFEFEIGPKDLLLPDAWRGEMRLTARLATQTDKDGIPVFDAEVTFPLPVKPSDPNRDSVRIFLDKPLHNEQILAQTRGPFPKTIQ